MGCRSLRENSRERSYSFVFIVILSAVLVGLSRRLIIPSSNLQFMGVTVEFSKPLLIVVVSAILTIVYVHSMGVTLAMEEASRIWEATFALFEADSGFDTDFLMPSGFFFEFQSHAFDRGKLGNVAFWVMVLITAAVVFAPILVQGVVSYSLWKQNKILAIFTASFGVVMGLMCTYSMSAST
jgi:hypothetical protein